MTLAKQGMLPFQVYLESNKAEQKQLSGRLEVERGGGSEEALLPQRRQAILLEPALLGETFC